MPRRQSTAESQDPLTSLAHDLLAHIVGYLPERQFDAAARTHTTLQAAVQARPITQGCKRRIRKLAKFESHMSSRRRGLNLSACLSLREPVRTQQLQLLQKWISDGRIIQLDLSNNGLTSQEVNYLALQSDSTSLTSINVGANRLVEEAALGIVRAVKPRDQMISLGLSDCNIGPRGAEEIAQYVSGSRVLTNLDLSSNQLCGIDVYGRGTYDPTGIQALASALGTSVLTVLDLGDNDIRVEGAKALADALKSGKCVLTECSLLKNDFDVETAKMLAKISTEKRIMLSGMKQDQTEVNFNYQDLQPADAILIASDLQFMAVLTSLNLTNNNIGGYYDDEDNFVSDHSGTQALVSALAGNAVLTSLNLADNALCGIRYGRGTYDPSGIQALASDLTGNAVLTDLNLAANEIGVEGARALADALNSGMAVLTKLNLTWNRIGVEGAKAFADVLKSGSSVLTKLDVRYCVLDEEAKQALRDAVKEREGFELKM